MCWRGARSLSRPPQPSRPGCVCRSRLAPWHLAPRTPWLSQTWALWLKPRSCSLRPPPAPSVQHPSLCRVSADPWVQHEGAASEMWFPWDTATRPRGDGASALEKREQMLLPPAASSLLCPECWGCVLSHTAGRRAAARGFWETRAPAKQQHFNEQRHCDSRTE